MRAEDMEDPNDFTGAMTSACLSTCRSRGRAYTLGVIAALDAATRNPERSESQKLATMQLLAKVEALVEQMELPIDPRAQP